MQDLSEDAQHREVFAWAGLALYCVQTVEHGLVNVIFLARVDDPILKTEYPTADDFYDAHFKRMLGRLISGLRESIDTPNDLDDLLDRARELRNFVVHAFFRERIELFVTEAGRQLMVNELADAVRLLHRLDKWLERIVEALGAQYGLTEETIRTELRKLEDRAKHP